MFYDLVESSRAYIEGKSREILAHRGPGVCETYIEHVRKVDYLVDFYLTKEERIINDLFQELRDKYELGVNYAEFSTILDKTVAFHDFGKFNPAFQKRKLDNPEFQEVEVPDVVLANHSIVGAVFLALELMEHHDLENNTILLVLSHLILGHHTRLRNVHEAKYGVVSLFEGGGNTEKFSHYQETLGYIYAKLAGKNDTSRFSEKINKLRNLYKRFYGNLNELDSTLSVLYNYLYSLLLKADSLASSYSERSLKDLKDHAGDYYQRIDTDLFYDMKRGFDEKTKEYEGKVNQSPLNSARNDMKAEATENLLEGIEEGRSVFYLKMPTGGGKTHTALGLSLKLIEETKASKMVYALPYMSLLEQNYDYIREVFNAEPGEDMRAIYSESRVPQSSNRDYLEDLITYDKLFEYPLICTTTVTFFNAIAKFDKSNKYKFASLANSVIVIDEVQTLPIEYWPEFNFLLNEVAEKLNTHVLIMSATLPGLEKLKHARKQKPVYDRNAHYLIDQENNYYRQFERNRIEEEELEEISISNTEDSEGIINLAQSVYDKCWGNFEEGNNHGAVIVNTVKASRALQKAMENIFEREGIDARCLLLNSTLISAKKRELVDRVKEMDEEEKVLLVSTQSIEAGMDVSFNFVIRDLAILESIEQARGRCNREKEMEDGKIYLTKLEHNNRAEAKKVYENWRLRETESILEETDFSYDVDDVDRYFDNCLERINKDVTQEMNLTSADNIRCWNRLNYEENNRPENKRKDLFHVDVIEEDLESTSFYVEINIEKRLLSDDQLSFLERKTNEQPDLQPIKEGKISGKSVLKLYSRELESGESGGYTKKRILQKQFSAIISKFTFSAVLPVEEEEVSQLLDQVGSYYVINEELIGNEGHDLYSPQRGFNPAALSKLAEEVI